MRCCMALVLALFFVAGTQSSPLLDLGSLTASLGLSGSGSVSSDGNVLGDVTSVLNKVLSTDSVLDGLTGNIEAGNILGKINNLLSSVTGGGAPSGDVLTLLINLLKQLLELLAGLDILDESNLTGILDSLPVTGAVTDLVKSLTQQGGGSQGGLTDLVGELLKNVDSVLSGNGNPTGSGISDPVGLDGILKGLISTVNSLLSGLTGSTDATSILDNINNLLGSLTGGGAPSDDLVTLLINLVKQLLEILLGKNLVNEDGLTGILDNLPVTGAVTDLVKSLTQQGGGMMPGSDSNLNDLKDVDSVLSGSALGDLTGPGITDPVVLDAILKDLSTTVNSLVNGGLDGLTDSTDVSNVLSTISNLLSSVTGSGLSDDVLAKVFKLVQELLEALIGGGLLDGTGLTGILGNLPITGDVTNLVQPTTQQGGGSSGAAQGVDGDSAGDLQDLLGDLMKNGITGSLGGLAGIIPRSGLDLSPALNKLADGDIPGAINDVLREVIPVFNGLVTSLNGGIGMLRFENGLPIGLIDPSTLPRLPSAALSQILSETKEPVDFLFSIDAPRRVGEGNFNDEIKAAIASAREALGDGSNGVRVGAVVNGAARNIIGFTSDINKFIADLEGISFVGHTLTPVEALKNSLVGAYLLLLQNKIMGRDTKLINSIYDGQFDADADILKEVKSLAASLRTNGVEILLNQITEGVTDNLSLDPVLIDVASPTAAGIPAVFRVNTAADLIASSSIIARIVLGALQVTIRQDSGGTVFDLTDVYGRHLDIPLGVLRRK